MQSIKLRLYKADDDQVAVVMARLDEASQKPLQPLSNPELATKRGRPAGSTKRKAIQREKPLFGARDWTEMFAMWTGWSQFSHMQCANI
ncbi:hypothetical protein BASA50_007258 [Batrachochytrium salamandrivorans]|uniref:Uncharacterized protein n=1 Tax=Batrachochytrium salamandrivorans TaxID=1357716 RepID=A0ABQ8F7L7_9FUNG|nr:hypothetical protein BASA62_000999 [Batrachochytrium salamandrivorans]KAH6593544.1 hypothetical protein BASA50_007258 [Batrachochytrium salamandrivorans]KAH6596353.1 hypothetical protein BASA61_003503 [Batrachochytrium salamandrivorans]KAH9265246.1 hypothetical protein BASA83_011247 [Batrachochytrium salamandrivorans]